jgi:hypothetical protein
MPPTRPVTGATIASDWGQAVHDYTFAPAGVIAHGSAALAMLSAGAYRKLNLDVADEDPGGYLVAASDQVEVPTGGGGLYLCNVVLTSDNGGTNDETNPRLQVNGVDVARDQENNEGTTAITLGISWMGVLAAGDIVSVRCRQNGTGDRADVIIDSFVLIRLGDEVGEPTP